MTTALKEHPMKRRTFLASIAILPAIVACGSTNSATTIAPFGGGSSQSQ
jgi:hypothetical protein